jgi:cysteinyl-tRNA synthetase
MHNEYLNMGTEKMSKSKGNVKTLSNLIERGIDPLAFRYFFMQAHYRQQQIYTDEAIQAAATGYKRLVTVAAALNEVVGEGDPERQAPFVERFRDALADDLNAPKAMAVVWEVARHDSLSEADRRDLLIRFDAVLALGLTEARMTELDDEWGSDPRIDGLLADRQAARDSKDWGTADRIRDDLAEEGIEIVDTPDGARWRKKENA